MQPELAPGDRVLVHAGLVVEVLSPEQARELEEALSELAQLDGGSGPGSLDQEWDGSEAG